MRISALELEPGEGRDVRISQFGLSYVGAVSVAALSRDGHHLTGVELCEERLSMVARGRSPIREPGLDRLFASGHRAGLIHATDSVAEALEGCELSFVSVGTPRGKDGLPDLRQVRTVAEQIGEHLHRAAPGHIVVLRSTVLPSTTRSVFIPALEKASGRAVGDGFDVCMHPEFLREGCALDDHDHPSRIVVGERVPGCGARLLEIYRDFEAPIHSVKLEVAESVKYADNAFHALKVAFGNEIGAWCDGYGVDPHHVMEIFKADTKLNISPKYLSPGMPYGGSCLSKDLGALVSDAGELGIDTPLLSSVPVSNAFQMERLLEILRWESGDQIAVLGLACKTGTDDFRNSASIELALRLHKDRMLAAVWDPALETEASSAARRELLPEIVDYLHVDVEGAVSLADTVVVTQKVCGPTAIARWRARGKRVINIA